MILLVVLVAVGLVCAELDLAEEVMPHINPFEHAKKEYNTAGGPKENVLNIHIVSHTHVWRLISSLAS